MKHPWGNIVVKTPVWTTIFLLTLAVGNAEAQLHIEPSAGKPVADYDLSIRLIPDAHRMEATGIITLPADSSVRNTVEFSLRSDMPDLHVAVIKPEVSAGAVQLRELGDDKEFQATKRWQIKPQRPFPTGAPVTLKVRYSGGSETKGLGFFNVGSEGSFASGWNSAWYPVFGHKRGSGSLSFTVPKGWVVKASGRQTAGRNTNEASVFEFTADKPSVFGFAAGPYTVVRRREGRVPVTLYLFKDHPLADEMLVGSSRAMAVLENEFGSYPFGEFAIVESPTEASQAAGFLGVALEGFFLARTDYLEGNNFDMAWFAHEMSHQWWPYLVEQKGGKTDLMLTEAMAHYGSLRAVEEIEGSAAAERHRRGKEAAIRLMATGVDYPLGSLPDESGSYSLSNSKGYVIYDLLSRTVGRDKFRAALRTVTSRYAFGAITWEEFLREIERAAGQDLAWFYEQWFKRAGAPTLSISWSQQGDSLTYRITQKGPAYRLKLPVQIEFSDGSAIMRETQVVQETTDLVIKMPGRVHAVRLDPHFEVFHTTPEERAEAEALRYFTRGHSQWNSSQPDEALETFQQGLQQLPEVDAYGVEYLLRLYAGWIHQEAGRLDEAKGQYELALAQAIRPADYLPRLYLNVAKIAQEQGDRQRVVWAAQNVLVAERALGQETRRSRQAKQLLSNGSR